MTDHRPSDERVRLAVIVTDFSAAANVGGAVETYVRTFDLPKEIEEHIRASRGQWTTVTLGLDVQK